MEYWVEHEFKPSGVTGDPVEQLPRHATRHGAVSRILQRQRQVAATFMALTTIILQTGAPLGLLHYYSSHAKFQRLFPDFLTRQWIEQAQMALTFWHTTYPLAPHMPSVANDFLVLMVHLGGCFPLPPGRQPLDRKSVLIAPPQNFVKMLREGRDVPPLLLRAPPVGCASPAAYAEWLETPQRHDVPAILDGYAQTIFITSPTGRPEPMDVTHTCCFDQAHYHTTPHNPNHPAVSVWATIQAWYDEPHITSIRNSPAPAYHGMSLRPLNSMLSDMSDIYVTPSTTWGTVSPPTRHTAAPPTTGTTAPTAQGLPMPATSRQPFQPLPLSTSRSAAPAMDMFAQTYQAPVPDRLENIAPDFSTTNRLPTPLVSPIPDLHTTAHTAPPIYGVHHASTPPTPTTPIVVGYPAPPQPQPASATSSSDTAPMGHGSHSAAGDDRTDNRRRAHTPSPEASSDSESTATRRQRRRARRAGGGGDTPLHRDRTPPHAGQGPTPFPSHKPTRNAAPPNPNPAPNPRSSPNPRSPRNKGGPASPQPAAQTGRATQVRICFISFLRHYKINMKTTNALPSKCEATCNRLHYKDVKGELSKAQVLDIARASTIVTEENRPALITAISADTKFK
ncbi:hypothetical protein B484DRAFT_467694 [Ochromonadaceae sp. CCMP2298]|nr:hypothetical protein B484DRAFT_467694 [Ochromonadaceae sp. CCMP2298]